MRFLKMKRRVLIPSLAGLLGLIILLGGCWLKNINTPYYTQITSYYCGAASAQMILNSAKIGIYVGQHTLYSYIHSHNQCSGWATDPKGLRDVLNLYYPAGWFIYYAAASQDSGVKKMAYTIKQYGVPPAALIYGCGHWVVVRGVMTDVEPTYSGAYTIYGFYVNDPWYGTPTSPTLGENAYIPISTWNTDYFTGCNWCGASGTRYISVVDPEPPPTGRVIYPEVKPIRPEVISLDEAIRFGGEYLEHIKSKKEFRENFPGAFRVIGKIKQDTPILVKRSDREKDGYYIIPLQDGELTQGAMLLNAYSGELKGVSFVEKSIKYTGRYKEKTAKELFKTKLPHLRMKMEPIKDLEKKSAEELKKIRKLPLIIKEADLRISKMELVWEPSIQSQNPYFPLWKVTGAVKTKRAETIGYMDFGGEVFNEIVKSDIKGGGVGK